MDAVVFEVSNEVAHKVGGIHAVIASKAPQMKKNFKDYYAVGPYDAKTMLIEFEPVQDHPFHTVFRQLAEQGIKCVYGKWIPAGKVNCILVDPAGVRSQTNEIKTKMWEEYRIDSLYSSDLFNDMMVWGKAVGIVIEKIMQMDEFRGRQVVCQFHEWLAGSAMLHLKSVNSRAALVFTTHATTMGRTMAERNEDLVGTVRDGLKAGKTATVEMAKSYGIESIHTLEVACARNADVFTTVSGIVAEEAKYVLGRYPDVLTLNGLAIETYPSMEELSIAHKQFWKKIRHFILAYFSPYYPLDIDDSLYFFSAGRYELHNKGFDMLIDAMGRLNDKLKKEKSKKTAVVFLWVPRKAKGENPEVLDNISMFESIDDEVMENLDKIKEHIIESVCSGKLPTKAAVFDEPFLYDLKQMIARIRTKRDRSAPLCAMDLDDQNDFIIKLLKEKGLDNAEDDRIKVIYYPTYLSPADGLIGLNYNEAVMGCHLGIFPSYYEPWGYTPLETAALAVPAVTTDQAGFGEFIKEHVKEDHPAIYILERKGKGDEVATRQLVDYMHFILNTTRKERVNKKIEAKRLSELADWQSLIKNYLSAYMLAIKNASSRNKDG